MTAHLLNDITQRGLVSQVSNIEQLTQKLETPQVVYCGFDPTAGSLHIGHLVPLIMLKRFMDAGHQGVALIGGATGLIGDPSFKATERSLNTKQTVSQWVDALANQVESVLGPHLNQPLQIKNNADWFSSIDVLDFFRDVGKHFSINTMINRESVKQRLQRPDQGLSFTEFSYSLLQSYDFAKLNSELNCTLQIGGNDQWGNIVSGIDLTRRLNQQTVFGLTLPLITKSDGTKFGKTEGGAIWLDPKKTSPYRFYQFWLNCEDADVYNFLRFYTFLSVKEIEAIEANDKISGQKPQAQRILAEQLTRFVHAEEGLASAQRITELLFNGQVQTLNLNDLAQLEQDGLPVITLTEINITTSALLVLSGLANSKRAARELIAANAVKINGETISADHSQLNLALHQRFWLIQRGKKQFRLIKLN
ncbi:tyrosine--tRNA ligase [Pseudoalteromonas sp. S1610]|uniref:tyrosine--tRNA ligase n=1 Tax=Pseudoalteromonas sp. S1610 TaxID=579506 RepID=UPI00110AB878|nr:tyrosine--tRNA ligase [Pseudoalteromonas sp. S1610]MBL0688450.1 tyrosine--tRNA ligase [Pseudoalteromonas sp.]TMP60861.1 tyrosine--tRNA ligase [Pseudoalteromonas sp. S1610]